MKTYIPLIFLLTGCATVQSGLAWLGLVDAAGDPTGAGEAISGTMYALTGVSLTRVYDLFFTKRGLGNADNIMNTKTGWKSSLWSMAAVLLGWNSPKESKATK